MAKDSNHLVVIDQSQERAQEIDSLLRNSGIALHVSHVTTRDDLTRLIEARPPFLLLIGTPPERKLPLETIASAAVAAKVPVALRTTSGDFEALTTLTPAIACTVINAEDNSQLIDTVRRSMASQQVTAASKGMQDKVDELEDRFHLLLDSAREAIAYIHEGLHVYANSAYMDALGVDSVEDLTTVSVLELLASEEIDLKKLLRDLGHGDFPERPLRLTLHSPGGREMEADVRFSAARFNGENCVQMVLDEVRAHSDVEAELHRLRSLDATTELNNRQTFLAEVDARLDRDDGDGVIALMYIEPDGIEDLEDSLGIKDVDAHLKGLANVIRAHLADSDLAGRITDHGIAILAQRPDRDGLEALGQTIVDGCRSEIIEASDGTRTASCSLGMNFLGTLRQRSDEIIAQARRAHNEAAEEGNRMVRYKPQISAVPSEGEDGAWAERIRYALNHQNFYSVQHSIVDLDGEGDKLFDNRSFLREDGNDLGEQVFLGPAENAHLGNLIDREMIPAVLGTIANPTDRHLVPISADSIEDGEFPGWLRQQFNDLGIQGSQVVLQVPVRTAGARIKHVQRLMDELTDCGCRLSLSRVDEDRGSLRVLEHLPVSYVKLDPGFSGKLSEDTKLQERAKDIVKSAEANEATVLAEEVKDSSEMAVLWQCGVKLVTGDFLKEAPQVVGQ